MGSRCAYQFDRTVESWPTLVAKFSRLVTDGYNMIARAVMRKWLNVACRRVYMLPVFLR